MECPQRCTDNHWVQSREACRTHSSSGDRDMRKRPVAGDTLGPVSTRSPGAVLTQPRPGVVAATAAPSPVHARQREVERRRHAVELERVDEQGAVADLASGAGAEKAAQLRMQLAAALRGLLLEAAERHELALDIEHTLHRRRADGAAAAAGEGFERGLVAPSMNSSDSPFAKRSLSHVAEKTT